MALTEEPKRKRPQAAIPQPTYAQRLGVNARNIRDEAAGLINGFSNVMNQAVANDAAAKQRIRGEVVQSFKAGTPTAAPAPAIKPAIPAPSFAGVTGGSSAQAPAVPAKPDTPAAAPATPAQANPNEVIGTFNGRAITRAESDRLAGKLPTASGPVVMGPNGSYAAATGGAGQAGYAASLAVPTLNPQPQSRTSITSTYVPSYFEGLAGSAAPSDPNVGVRQQPSPALLGQLPVWPGSPAAPSMAQQPNPVPSLAEVQGSAVIGTPSGGGTEAERAKLMSNLSSQINELQMGGANMRSKRDLLSTLIGMQARMNEAKAGNDVTLAGQQNAADIAALNEQGAWNRSVLGEQGANRRADMTDVTTRQLGAARELGDTYRTFMGLQPKAEYVTDANGNTVRVDGTQYTAVTGADGAPLRTQQKDSGLTAKDLLADITAREKNLSDLRAMGDTPELQAQAQQLAQERAALMTGGSRSVPEAGTVKNGYRFKGGDPADKNNWEKVQ